MEQSVLLPKGSLMKGWSALVAVALALPASSAAADTLVLADGRIVEWRALKDNGDTYEVQTADAKTLVIRKKDIKEVRVGGGGSPLTGATFTDATKPLAPVDLLALVDVKRDSVHGNWRRSGQGLVAQNEAALDAFPRIQIPHVPPEEYDLAVVVERKDGDSDFALGLAAGGRQFCLRLDGFRSAWSGLDQVDGQQASENQTRIAGKFFTNGKPRTITVSVRKEWIRVVVDGKDFLSMGDGWAQRVSLHAAFSVKDGRYLFLAASQGTYTVTRLVLTPRK